MTVERYFLDQAHYHNRQFCICGCHNEFYEEMNKKACDGCTKLPKAMPGCEWVRKFSPPPKTENVCFTMSTGKEQEAVRMKGKSLTGEAE